MMLANPSVSGQQAQTMPPRGRTRRIAHRPVSVARWWGLAVVVVIVLCWGGSFVVGFEKALTILTIAGLFFAAGGLYHPVLGLFGIGLVCTIDPLTRSYLLSGGLLRWNTINYWLMLVVFLNARQLLQLSWTPLRVLEAFLAVLGLLLLNSQNVTLGIQHFLGIFAILGLVAYFVRSERSPQKWVWLGVVCGVASAVGGLVYQLHADQLEDINPNSYAHAPLAGLFAVCLGYRFAMHDRLMRWVLPGLAVVNTGWVFLTGSRGGMLIALCCLLFLFHTMRSLAQRVVMIAGVVMVGVFLTAQFAQQRDYSLGRLMRLMDSSRSMDNRTSGRSDLVMGGWNIFKEHPIWGVGTGSFAAEYARTSFRGNLAFGRGLEKQAHAGWIKVLAENGLIGFTLLLLFLLSFAWVGWRRRREGLLAMGLLPCVVIMVALISTEFQSKALWLLAAGCLSLLHGRQWQGGESGISSRIHTPHGKPVP